MEEEKPETRNAKHETANAVSRICFISRRFFPTISGMSVYALNLLQELVRLGHDVTMVSQYRGDAVGREIYGDGPPMPVEGVDVIGLESVGEQEGGDFERDIREMADVVGREHERAPFDVVHAQYGYPTGLAALEASRRLGVPNVVSIQGGDGHWVGSCCRAHRAAMIAVLDHAGALLIGSCSFADEVTDRLGTLPERFTIVPGAVNVERFQPEAGRDVGAFADAAEPVLLYHGRVDARKGVLDLLDAFEILAERRPLRLVLSGIGPDLEAVRERAALLGSLQGRVDVTGYAAYADAPDVYRRGDVFVSPTYAEGFSNTILEAMASGLPIVSTEVVGVVDCLRDGENALLVPPRNPEALASAIGRMLDDAELRGRLARYALEEARTEYAWSTIAEQIADVYRTLEGTAPDTAWTLPAGPPDPCRFRAEPHLL